MSSSDSVLSSGEEGEEIVVECDTALSVLRRLNDGSCDSDWAGSLGPGSSSRDGVPRFRVTTLSEETKGDDGANDVIGRNSGGRCVCLIIIDAADPATRRRFFSSTGRPHPHVGHLPPICCSHIFRQRMSSSASDRQQRDT